MRDQYLVISIQYSVISDRFSVMAERWVGTGVGLGEGGGFGLREDKNQALMGRRKIA